MPPDLRLSVRLPLISLVTILCLQFACTTVASAQSAYVRVSQVGYETGKGPFRAYLMSTAAENGATFKVLNSKGTAKYVGNVGSPIGTWSHSKAVSYSVYAIDFTVSGGDLYKISISGPAAASSASFAVDCPNKLYSGLLLNTLFFYETERDGANFIPNALRDAPGHLKDAHAGVYQTPPIDTNDFVDNVPPVPPLTSANSPNIDASGGWWDARRLHEVRRDSQLHGSADADRDS